MKGPFRPESYLMKPKLQVIIGSTRPGRVGPAVARWFEAYAKEHGAFDVSLVDLASFHLPIYDEPNHPRMQKYTHEHTINLSNTIKQADAYVFVTPEYNYSPPAALLNALQFIYLEWNYKVAGVVSYGGVSGGLRAAEALKPSLSAVKLVTLPEGVAIPNVAGHIDAEKTTFAANDMHGLSAKTLLDEMAKWEKGLKSIRG